ncbi:hypothetical protein GCM10023085_71130 [Actinomadura viridis]
MDTEQADAAVTIAVTAPTRNILRMNPPRVCGWGHTVKALFRGPQHMRNGLLI